MSRSEGVIAFKILPGKTFELKAPGDIRFTQVALHDELAESSSVKGRTVLKMTHTRPHSHGDEDDEDEEEEVDEEDGHAEGTVSVACLIPGVVETQLLGGLIVNAGELVVFSLAGKNTVHISGNIIVQSEFDMDPEASELDYDSEEGEFDAEELEGMDEDEQNEFLAALSRGGAPQIEAAPKESASTPSKKLTKAEKKALKESAPVPVVVAATTTTTTTTTVSAAAAGLDAAVGQKRRASDAAAPAGAKEKKEKDAPAAKKVKGQDGKAVPAAAAATTPTKEPKAKEVAKEKKSDKSFTTPGGVKITEKTAGDGPGAKRGQRLSMRYILKLANGKVADKNTAGAPFSFRLGAGEVIKGWDEGLLGMKVGGERTLEVPPALGYGKKGVQGIPGNSTLYFEVKLLTVK